MNGISPICALSAIVLEAWYHVLETACGAVERIMPKLVYYNAFILHCIRIISMFRFGYAQLRPVVRSWDGHEYAGWKTPRDPQAALLLTYSRCHPTLRCDLP